MLIFEESNLRFEFNEDYQLIKSDENINFKNIKQYLPETKDIDFVGFYLQEKAFFLEVKNFKGSKPEDIDTLTTKIAQKLRDTIAIIAGAARNSTNDTEFWQKLHQKIGNERSEIFLIFWLEEDDANYKSKTKPRLTIINQKLKQKCKWLNAKISVQNKQTHTLIGLNTSFLPITP
jgi:hypothetical protein